MNHVLLLDFDSTITMRDVGDALCEQFADPSWRYVDARWQRGEISLPDAQKEMWATVRADSPTLARAARQIPLRAGLDAMLDRAEAAGAPIIVASGGFEPYVRWILGDRVARLWAIFANDFLPSPAGMTVSFPHREQLGCPTCGVCKGAVCRYVRTQVAEAFLTYVGDGASDLCAIGQADRLFAIRGSTLHERAASAGVAVQPIDNFDPIHFHPIHFDPIPTP